MCLNNIISSHLLTQFLYKENEASYTHSYHWKLNTITTIYKIYFGF